MLGKSIYFEKFHQYYAAYEDENERLSIAADIAESFFLEGFNLAVGLVTGEEFDK